MADAAHIGSMREIIRRAGEEKTGRDTCRRAFPEAGIFRCQNRVIFGNK